MKPQKTYFWLLFFVAISSLKAQDAWKLTADKIDPNHYFGETTANGMIGIVSSPDPLRVK